ncbi:MAG: hypothetical protein HYU88_11460 [Chloroflexi bacterium]|nr:hypothetical protein [Chloroflexota bacterium]
MRLMLCLLISGLVLAGAACQPTAPAAPTAPGASVVVQPDGSVATRSVYRSVDRGDEPVSLIGEAQGEDSDLRVRTWVTRTELMADDELGLFAMVERDGRPLPNAVVLVMLASGGAPSITRLQTGPDGLVAVKLSGKSFRVGVASQILVSARDGQDAADAELRVFVDSSGAPG